jgi:hypothetical protein
MLNLAQAYDLARDPSRAEAVFRRLLEVCQKAFGPGHRHTALAQRSLGGNLLGQQKYAEAEPLLRDCLDADEKGQPDAWTTFQAKSLLGEALLGQKKYADAEPLLRAGHEGLKRRAAHIPVQSRAEVAEAARRLVRLYDAWGRPERAAQWRKTWQKEKNAARPMKP